MFFYGVIGGIGCGINYMVPLVCAWDHFPNKKGLMTGIIVGAYGFGSFIYTRIAKEIINPEGERANVPSG